MLAWSIQVSIISIVFIFLVHHLFTFLKTTLTVPKIKDLVNSPNQKYQNIFNTLSHNTSFNNETNSNPNSYTSIDLLPSETEGDNMKNELKSFLKKQLNGNSDTIPSLEPRLDFSSGSVNTFASF
jgi:hypothetical protein